jgi:hypothetical protein
VPFRDSPETDPSRIRIRNLDGSVNIHCRRCGYFICKTSYNGYSSAICYWCEQGLPRPEVLNPQEELLREIFGSPDANMTIEQMAKPKKKFNLLDMIVNTVTALGFGKNRVEEIDQEKVVYPTADNESSKKVARRKLREPIFQKRKDK